MGVTIAVAVAGAEVSLVTKYRREENA